MKQPLRTLGRLIAGLLLALPTLPAQTYSVDWSKIAGGGGTMAGGSYSLTGCFWSLNYRLIKP